MAGRSDRNFHPPSLFTLNDYGTYLQGAQTGVPMGASTIRLTPRGRKTGKQLLGE